MRSLSRPIQILLTSMGNDVTALRQLRTELLREGDEPCLNERTSQCVSENAHIWTLDMYFSCSGIVESIEILETDESQTLHNNELWIQTS